MALGRHYNCLISGIHQGGGATQGPSELDKHPAWKMRRKHQASQRRLRLHLADLDQRCDEITNRISHDMKLVRQKLNQYKDHESDKFIEQVKHWNKICVLPKDNEPIKLNENGSSPSGSGTSRNVRQDKENFDTVKPQYQKLAQHDNGQLRDTEKLNDLQRLNSNKIHNSPFAFQKSRTPSSNISPASRRRRRRLVPRPCDFGTTKSSSHCSHFPCRQPKTYHSLGFRLDDSSTDEWVTWEDLKKIKMSNVPNHDQGGSSASGDSIKHRLPPGTKLKPLDVEFREKLLEEEVERRRRMNELNKPLDWEINYGQPTPYKRLRLPVRLKPMELTSW